MTRRSPPLPLLGGIAALLSCGPTPSSTDAAILVTPSDATRPDHAAADSARADASTLDLGTQEAGAPDTVVAADRAPTDQGSDDTALPDSSQPDLSAPDTAQPDLGAPDAGSLFFGPYSAPGLPRTIADATASSPRSTDSVITVPVELNAAFVDVYAVIAHDDAHDLVVRLIPPAPSSTTELFNGDSCEPGTCANPLEIDEVRIPVQAGTQGEWVLRITDRYQTQTGMLQSYNIAFLP